MATMNKDQCHLFETCEAPLCPLQANTVENGVWYADEEICRTRKHHSLQWIKKQKRIVRLGLTSDIGYFTVEMLNAIQRVTRNTKGADADVVHSKQQWFKSRSKEAIQ